LDSHFYEEETNSSKLSKDCRLVCEGCRFQGGGDCFPKLMIGSPFLIAPTSTCSRCRTHSQTFSQWSLIIIFALFVKGKTLWRWWDVLAFIFRIGNSLVGFNIFSGSNRSFNFFQRFFLFGIGFVRFALSFGCLP
jgi:hypothetical protein